MNALLIAGAVLAQTAATNSDDLIYEGSWIVTNRPLEGTMMCAVTQVGDDSWHGHFYGLWENSPFSYRVDFKGPKANLRGHAIIDGARYEWTGVMSDQPPMLRGTFGGDRYAGSFNLKRKAGNERIAK
jgi:hypothetical protein